jgi:CRP/FNR family transcriptional regulator, cyclic AMP receptor protein
MRMQRSKSFAFVGTRRLPQKTQQENSMKSKTKDKVRIKARERLSIPITDPTLEGKDGSKVGRVQEKISPVDWETFLANIFHENSVMECRTDRNIFKQGEPADSLFYLRRGKVKLTAISPQGKEAIVSVLGAGEFFGEGCLAGQRLRIATAVAITDCTVEKIERSVMVGLLHEQHQLSEMFIRHLLSRNLRYEADLVDQLFSSSEKRLARILLLLAHFGKESRPESVVPAVTQETLAQMAGTTRSSVSRYMNKFKSLGLIDYNGHGLTVNSSLLNVVLHD